MRVIQFPSAHPDEREAALIAELEAAFDGDGTGPEAEAWRELRADVRSLAPPIDPPFEHALEQQLRESPRPRRASRWLPSWLRAKRLPGWRGLALAGVPSVIAAVIVAAVVLGSSGGPRPTESAPTHVKGPARRDDLGPVNQGDAEAEKGAPFAAAGPAASAAGGKSHSESSSGALVPSTASEAPGESSRRLQQLSASISLGARNEGVQAVADRVGQLAVAAGGFVESSKVELHHGSAGEATLTLKLPSAKLASVLARLQRLAPVRAETQSLQDVTGQYNAVGARLSAARAERSALLQALAKAETTAALESLHQRIAQADATIASGEREQAAISHSASQAEVEVSVLGESGHAHAAGGGLTVGRGLHDAGHVLAVSAAVLLIVLAVLLPLALLLAGALLGGRGWRRQHRERALGPS